MILGRPTCIPSNPVEHLIPYARLELAFDLVEIRYATIVHELGRTSGGKYLGGIVAGRICAP